MTAAGPLPAEDCRTVLALARESLRAHLRGIDPPPLDVQRLTPGLQRVAACFVTLTKNRQLRGCILDSFSAHESIAENVARNVVLAATADPRFPPVREDEVDALAIEVSVLGAPYDIDVTTPEDLISRIRPNIDGVILTSTLGSSTFLPQVWQQLPDPVQFLGELCRKHGAPADCWTTDALLRIQLYQAEHFSDADPKGLSPPPD